MISTTRTEHPYCDAEEQADEPDPTHTSHEEETHKDRPGSGIGRIGHLLCHIARTIIPDKGEARQEKSQHEDVKWRLNPGVLLCIRINPLGEDPVCRCMVDSHGGNDNDEDRYTTVKQM